MRRANREKPGRYDIDATIVRGVLLPAGLALLGDRAFGSRPGHGAAPHDMDKALIGQA